MCVSKSNSKILAEHQKRQIMLTKRLVSKMDFKHPNAYELLLKNGFFGPHYASLVSPYYNHLSLENTYCDFKSASTPTLD